MLLKWIVLLLVIKKVKRSPVITFSEDSTLCYRLWRCTSDLWNASVHKSKSENAQQFHIDCRQIIQQPFPLCIGLWLVTSYFHFTGAGQSKKERKAVCGQERSAHKGFWRNVLFCNLLSEVGASAAPLSSSHVLSPFGRAGQLHSKATASRVWRGVHSGKILLLTV